jgi:hypothetical protein
MLCLRRDHKDAQKALLRFWQTTFLLADHQFIWT